MKGAKEGIITGTIAAVLLSPLAYDSAKQAYNTFFNRNQKTIETKVQTPTYNLEGILGVAYAADPEAEALARKGRIALFKKDYAKAFEYYKQSVEIEPILERYAVMASCLVYMEQPEEAIKYAEKAINLDQNNSFPYSSLAIAYEKMGKIDEAKKVIQKALEIKNKNGEKPQKEFIETYNRIMSYNQ